ncbi:major facilitator superfamily domain-containing protein [Podospora fimiseda]|uniref:Major facilitator superfamily domain-containing protein n=1 Tax=Podospora fimiseda TaxID=252190 RepID=A0AAN7H2J7_9PEZI|nr:major facilitator superfamily domain-containing protein [Podospora fimiseda]
MAAEKRSLTSLGSGSGQSAQVARGADSRHMGSEPGSEPNDIEMLTPRQSPQDPGGGEELYQPKSFKFWGTIACNFLALFLVALDRTIVATAVPRISDEFKALGDIGWYGSSYMLTTACAQLVFGRIYKNYDLKWTFLISIVVFEVGSAICGAAPNSPTFILGRAIAGLGSAGIFSGTLLALVPMVPLHRRPAFQSFFGIVFGLSSVLGPIVGGGFTGTQSSGWRWCFYINLPIGAVVLVVMTFWWNPPSAKHEPASFKTHVKRLDPLGIIFLLPGVVSLFMAFQWGGSTYDWNSWRVILLLVVFVVCTIAFWLVQHFMPATATVPGRILKQRTVFFGTIFTFFISGSMLMLVYYLPIWFQTVKQVDPLKSGIYTLPLVLSLVISSIGSGILCTKLGYYVPSMLAAPSIMAIGEGLLTTINRDTPSKNWIAYQFLCGFGLGFGMQTSGLAIQAVLGKGDLPIGIAINMFVQQLGGAVFTSVGQTILTNLLVSQLSGIEGFNPKDIVQEGATLILEDASPELRARIIGAYEYACRHVFICAMSLSFAALLAAFGMEWINIKKGRGAPSQAPGPPAAAAAATAPSGPTSPNTPSGPIPGKPLFDASNRHSKSSSCRDSITEQKMKGKDDKSGPNTGVLGAEIIRSSSGEEKKAETVPEGRIDGASSSFRSVQENTEQDAVATPKPLA